MSPPIFACPPPARALVALILIENSHLLLPAWDSLARHVLPALLGTMRAANPVLPIPVLWLTTAPVGDDPASTHGAPRQFNQLPELKFSAAPDNKITSRIINRAAELMLEAATQFQGVVCFHLFIVAASSPMQDTWGVSVTMPTQIGQSEWQLLSQRIAQLGIHCHAILPTSQDTSSIIELFNSTLQLQGRTQVPPWFQTPPDYTFLLSGIPSSPTRANPDSPFPTLDPIPPADIPQPPLFAAPRPPVLRHQSFPQDVQSATTLPSPSLVTSLQKVHGLSRKKLYGTQQQRQPFVREEPVRAKYKSSPTPLSIPVGSQPLHTSEDPRVLGKTKVERGRRADRPTSAANASSSISPGRKSPWNHATPSDIASSSSPTSSSHHTISPTVYPDIIGYPPSPHATAATFSPGILSSVPIPETASLVDTSTFHPVFHPSTSMGVPVPSPGPIWTPMSKPVPMVKSGFTAVRRHSQELPHGSHTQSLSAMSSKYRLDTVSTEPRPTPKSTQKVKDAGDVPFIYSAELEAATAAKLKAALQSTSPVSSSVDPFSAFTSGNQPNYAATEDAYAALAPLGYDQMQDATPTGLVNGYNHCGDEGPHCFGSTSSSLQGWAG